MRPSADPACSECSAGSMTALCSAAENAIDLSRDPVHARRITHLKPSALTAISVKLLMLTNLALDFAHLAAENDQSVGL